MERHHLTWKVAFICRCSNFKGIFVHQNYVISQNFLHKSCRSLSSFPMQLESSNLDIYWGSYGRKSATWFEESCLFSPCRVMKVGAESWQQLLVTTREGWCRLMTAQKHSKACFLHSFDLEWLQYVHITFISFKQTSKTSIRHSNSYKFTKNNGVQKHL